MARKVGRRTKGLRNSTVPRRPGLLRAQARPSARARLERVVRVTSSAGDDTIHLRLEWTGGAARLIELRDNETDIHISSSVGPWVYHAAPAGDHFIEWHLFAPDLKLADLKAFARLDRGQAQGKEKLIAKADSSDGGWIFGGDLT